MTIRNLDIDEIEMEIETESLSSRKSVIDELEPGQEISMIPRWNGEFLLDDLDDPVETKEAAVENEEQEPSQELRPLRVSNSNSPHRNRQGRKRASSVLCEAPGRLLILAGAVGVSSSQPLSGPQNLNPPDPKKRRQQHQPGDRSHQGTENSPSPSRRQSPKKRRVSEKYQLRLNPRPKVRH